MAQFPGLLLWTDSWVADTAHLTRLERGTYHDLLVLMWRTPGCRVPNDNAWLAKHMRMSPQEISQELRPIITEFCQSDGNYLWQKRLQKEFVRSFELTERQTSRAGKRWKTTEKTKSATRAERMAAARRRGTHTQREWEALKQIIGACVHCGTQDYPLEKDHIVPVYQGGSDAIENIQPSCARCNARKGPEAIDKRPPADVWVEHFEKTVGRKLLIAKSSHACLPTPYHKRESFFSRAREDDEPEDGSADKKVSKVSAELVHLVAAKRSASEE